MKLRVKISWCYVLRKIDLYLFQVLLKGVDLDLISRQVLPALVTLASDSQM